MKALICPSCGAPITENDKSCSYCYAALIFTPEEGQDIKVTYKPGIISCPACGQELPESYEFCPNEGRRMRRFCFQCGNKDNLSKERFCGACGVSLAYDFAAYTGIISKQDSDLASNPGELKKIQEDAAISGVPWYFKFTGIAGKEVKSLENCEIIAVGRVLYYCRLRKGRFGSTRNYELFRKIAFDEIKELKIESGLLIRSYSIKATLYSPEVFTIARFKEQKNARLFAEIITHESKARLLE